MELGPVPSVVAADVPAKVGPSGRPSTAGDCRVLVKALPSPHTRGSQLAADAADTGVVTHTRALTSGLITPPAPSTIARISRLPLSGSGSSRARAGASEAREALTRDTLVRDDLESAGSLPSLVQCSAASCMAAATLASLPEPLASTA